MPDRGLYHIRCLRLGYRRGYIIRGLYIWEKLEIKYSASPLSFYILMPVLSDHYLNVPSLSINTHESATRKLTHLFIIHPVLSTQTNFKKNQAHTHPTPM